MYSSDLYQKALNRLDRRREEDELRTAATLAEVSAKVPGWRKSKISCDKWAFPSPRRSLPKTRRRRSTSCKRKACACKEKERLLVAAGYAPDALAHHYQCPTCKDTGYVGDRMCTCQRELLKDLQRRPFAAWRSLDSCTLTALTPTITRRRRRTTAFRPGRRRIRSPRPAIATPSGYLCGSRPT